MSSASIDWSICPATDTLYEEIVAGGTTVYLRGKNCLTAVDTEERALNWHRSVDRMFEFIVASECGLVGISKNKEQNPTGIQKSCRLVSFDIKDGNPRWKRDVTAGRYDLCLQEDDLFLALAQGDEVEIRALDVSTGGVSWNWSFGSVSLNLSVASDLTTTYVCLGSTIHAFDRQNGTHEWQSDFESTSTLSRSLRVNPLTVSRGNIIEVINTASGSTIWSFSRQIESMLAEHVGPDHIDDQITPGPGGACEAPDEFVLRVVGRDTESIYITGHFRTSYTRRADMEWWTPKTDHVFVLNQHDGTIEHHYRIPAVAEHSEDIEYSTCFGALLRRDTSGISGYDPRTGNESWRVSLNNRMIAITDELVVTVGSGSSCDEAPESSGNRDIVVGLTPSGGDTQIYVSRCSNCNADLNEYDDPTFCPECGIDTSGL